MEFWALEHANDATIMLFGFTIIGFFLIGCVISLIDWIKKRYKK